MTKCEKCEQQEATVHFAKVVSNRKEEIHLCEECAKEYDNTVEHVFNKMGDQGFGAANLIKQMENLANELFPERKIAEKLGKVKACPKCGLTLQDFVRTGKFGCPNDYDFFAEELKPIMVGLQGGHSQHVGKFPKNSISIKQQAKMLEEEMASAIKAENYERAAQIRDQIKNLQQVRKE